MSRNEYLSTGEAARILNISRSTVSRRFDAGQLEGKLNPITGERLIAGKSVEETIRKHNLPIDLPFVGLKHVVVSTADQDMSDQIDVLIGDDARLQVEVVTQGADTLIACSKSSPDLLIVDEQLPDLRGSHVIKSLRKYVDMEQMKILYCGKGIESNAHAASNMWGADASIDVATQAGSGVLGETVYRLLAIPSEAAPHKGSHEHKRRWPRFSADIDAKLAVFPSARPNEQVCGSARISNISKGGAYLTDIFIDGATFPAESFRLALSVDDDKLQDWNAKCQVMRLQSNGSMSAGVQFDDISAEDRRKISKLQPA